MKLLNPCRMILLFCLIIASSGCAQMKALGEKMENMAAENRLNAYSSVQDKNLVDSMYEISQDGKTHNAIASVASDGYIFEEISSSVLVLKKDLFRTNNMGEMASAMYSYSYDSESDSLSKTYINMAIKRGNIVKVFKPKMTKVVNSIFKQPFKSMEASAEWYDRDVTLIEFDSTARPVSILTRAHQAQTSLGVNSYLYASVLSGSANMRYFENKVPNSIFEDTLLRELD